MHADQLIRPNNLAALACRTAHVAHGVTRKVGQLEATAKNKTTYSHECVGKLSTYCTVEPEPVSPQIITSHHAIAIQPILNVYRWKARERSYKTLVTNPDEKMCCK